MLEVTGLSAGYGQVEVLHGLDFQVPKGQVVALIGSNGAGKTTTMRALSGMIRPRADHAG
jgi:branched-chain amino acid transport system ATP-binding protein